MTSWEPADTGENPSLSQQKQVKPAFFAVDPSTKPTKSRPCREQGRRSFRERSSHRQRQIVFLREVGKQKLSNPTIGERRKKIASHQAQSYPFTRTPHNQVLNPFTCSRGVLW
jgi:hypothetical protein